MGAAGAWWIASHIGAVALANEQATHAKDNERHAADLTAMSRAALDAQQRAIAEHDTAANRVADVDAQLTKERETHETDSARLRADLASGAQRLRVAVANCAATGRNGVPGTASAARGGDGATAFADLDRSVAQRVFGVAADDQREIDKLKALQGYVCAVRPATAGCTGNR
ncbi:MAG: lysis protein [Paraburkholderia sp.]|nr:lysis protein [Paraburkholderia sp.]